MNARVDDEALARFSTLVAERLGLHITGDRLTGLRAVLAERMAKTGAEQPERYLERVASSTGDGGELRALAPALTIGETYFLRNAAQLEALAAIVGPRLEAGRAVSLLSAGCASGEEAYSIAILLRERFGEAARRAVIRGVDVNPAAIAKARAGRYAKWSLRETPAAILQRYFARDGGALVVADDLRRGVSFEERNLVEDDPSFFRPDAFDVVLCRNVIMYFTPAAARGVVARFARSLTRGGHLFLGHAETLRGLSGDFRLCQARDTFFYRVERPGDPPLAAADAPSNPPAAAAEETPADWMTSIQRASDRIERLSRGGGASIPPAPVPAAPGGDDGGHVDAALALLHAERFVEALAELDAVPAPLQGGARVRLLRAVLLTNAGDPEVAEELSRSLLAEDPSNAGAHYLIALCRERAGDVDGAVDHDRAAARADPSFAMPRLHLGLMLKRGGARGAARVELEAARALLADDAAANVALFGGGFTRAALVDLCRAELYAVRGGDG